MRIVELGDCSMIIMKDSDDSMRYSVGNIYRNCKKYGIMPAVTLDGEEYLSFYQTPSDMIYTAGRLILFFKEGIDSRFHVGDKVKTVI